MAEFNDLISIGFDKNGEADFRIRMSLTGLSFEQMKDLRAMVCVAIGSAEDIWRRHCEAQHPVSSNIVEIKEPHS